MSDHKRSVEKKRSKQRQRDKTLIHSLQMQTTNANGKHNKNEDQKQNK